jgi:hypothetical protein
VRRFSNCFNLSLQFKKKKGPSQFNGGGGGAEQFPGNDGETAPIKPSLDPNPDTNTDERRR